MQRLLNSIFMNFQNFIISYLVFNYFEEYRNGIIVIIKDYTYFVIDKTFSFIPDQNYNCLQLLDQSNLESLI